MRKTAVYILLGLALALTACSGAAPTPTPAPTATVAPPTATIVPSATQSPTPAATNTPKPTDTPAPTATDTASPTPAATATPDCAESDANTLTVKPFFTLDSQYVVLGTGCGVEAFEAQTLNPAAKFGGLTLLGATSDGRVAAFGGSHVVLVNPATSELEALPAEVELAGLTAVSPTGQQLAQVVDAATVRLIDLNSGAATDLTLDAGKDAPPDSLQYTPDGAALAVAWTNFCDVGTLAVYDAATGAQQYTTDFFGAPQFSPDGQYLISNSCRDYTLYDPATGTAAQSFPNNIMNCRGAGSCGNSADGGTIVEDRDDMLLYFMPAGPEHAITFWTHALTWIPPGVVVTQENFSTAYKNIYTESAFVMDLTTNTRTTAIATQGLVQADFLTATGAPDGSVFLLLRTSGGLLLYGSQDGRVITSLDRFTLP